MDSSAFFTQEAAVQQVVPSSLHQELSGDVANNTKCQLQAQL